MLARQQLQTALVQQLVTLIRADLRIVKAQNGVDLHTFSLAYLHLNAADRIDHIHQTVKIHRHVSIHRYAEILFQRLFQQTRAALGVAGVNAVAAASRNFHVHIPQKGDHFNGLAFGIQLHQHRRIAAATGVFRIRVRTNQQQIIGGANI